MALGTTPNDTRSTEVVEKLLQKVERAFAVQDFLSARDTLALALQIRPDNAELLVASGFASFQLEDFEAAEEKFEHTILTQPEHQPAHANLAAVLTTRGRAPEAELVLRRALVRFPWEPELSSQLAEILVQREKFEEAVNVYADIITSTPTSIAALLGAAVCFCYIGDLATARAACEDALRVDPDNPKAREMLEMTTAGPK